MKKLTNLILGLTFVSAPLFSQEFLPEEFRDYKKRGKELFHDSLPCIPIDNFLFQPRVYDINNDGLEDIAEFYIITGYFGEGFKTLNYPKYYFFDLNFNGKEEDYEWLLDPEMDGLNGNEKLLYSKPSKFKPTKIEI